jgi:hypothetical protein
LNKKLQCRHEELHEAITQKVKDIVMISLLMPKDEKYVVDMLQAPEWELSQLMFSTILQEGEQLQFLFLRQSLNNSFSKK